MARVTSYQVLRDTSMTANVSSETSFGTAAVGFSYTFFVPQGLITDRNRARPILECECRNPASRESLLTFRIGGADVIGLTVRGQESKQIREVFDWRSLSTQPLTPGTGVPVTATYGGTGSRTMRLSDIVIWYQIETDEA